MNMKSVKDNTTQSFSADSTIVLGGEVSVGPMSSQGTFKVDGKNVDLIVSVRQAYLNLFYKNLLELDGSKFKYTFGDYNLSFDLKLNDRQKLFLIGYLGRDKASLGVNGSGNDINVKWKNYMSLVKLESQCGNSLFFRHLIHHCHYNVISLQIQIHLSLWPLVSDNNINICFKPDFLTWVCQQSFGLSLMRKENLNE